MIYTLWITLVVLSFILIFLGFYENNFFTAPNYVLIFFGFSFIFILGIPLFQSDVQIPDGWEVDVNDNWSVTYADAGSFNVGFFFAMIGIMGAFLTFLHYKTPKRMEGIT